MQFLTIAEAARQIASRKLSPVELARHCLDRIAADDSKLNSFILVTPSAPWPTHGRPRRG